MSLFDGIGNVMGDIVGPALSFFGTRSTNEDQIGIANANNIFNAQQAQQAEDFSASQAQINRDFQASQVQQQEQYQTQMSDTAYQRAVSGMEAAGLNPMLAYGQGPASTPVGASASGSSASGVAASSAGIPHITSPLSSAVNSAYAGAHVIADLRTAFAGADKAEAEASNARAVNSLLAPKMEQDIRTAASSAGQLDAFTKSLLEKLPYEKGLLQNEAALKVAQEAETDTRRYGELATLEAGGQQADVAATKASIGLRNAQALLSTQSAKNLGLAVPGLERQAEFYKGPFGAISPYVDDAAKLVSTARGLFSIANPLGN